MSSQAFTLIEMMIVFVLITILTLIAVPTFTSLIQNHRLSATAENLYYVIQLARSEAVKNNTSVYISFLTGDSWCFGVNAGSSCNCSVAGSCTLGSYSAPQAQQLSLSSTYSSNMNFEGTHGAASASGSFTLTLYGQTSPLMTINIGMMGNAQMCSTGITGYTAC